MTKRMKKPTVEELREYAKSIGYTNFDAEYFWHYNQSRGWMVGKHPMKNWKDAVWVWRRNAPKFGSDRKMTYKTRQDKINELNRRKQELMRTNAPYWKIHEINMQLSKL